VALVGGSGSGKSTLINMLMRFYDPTAGEITISGRSLSSFSRESLRARIGVVLQETFLFDSTIRENVELARPDATTDEIVAACTDAGIHEHISGLREGYESRAGERGGRMSGGQRQRIAIARAILRQPDLMILDEATSALDPATEAEVNATLRRVAQGRTTVSATHRLASIVDADLIVVLEGGRVAEQGTHVALLAAGGRYKELWDKQSSITVETTPKYTIDPAALRDVELLSSLDDDQLGEVAALLTSQQHLPDDVVFSQGDRGDALYIVARGRIEIVQDDEVIRVLEDGDHFGEIALVSAEERTAGARVANPTVLLRLAREAFDGLLDRHPDLRDAIVQSAHRRLEQDAQR
jgi:ATP-binding cassette subfamily B protein